MLKRVIKDLEELQQHAVIDKNVAESILQYYKSKEGSSQNRLFIVFGILGALLVGLGIVLIVAHNWDNLSKTLKTILAFLPLIVGQGLCLYTFLRKTDNVGWKESSSIFLVLAIGACMSLISQIYQIQGDLASFVFTWALLSLPVAYVMKSSMASLLYIIAITFYATDKGYWTSFNTDFYNYWWLLALILPYYYKLFKKYPGSNFTTFHHWLIPISLTIGFGTSTHGQDEFMLLAYMSLFGLFYLIGDQFLSNNKLRNNGYLVIGSLGTNALLLSLSFDWFWQDVYFQKVAVETLFNSPEFSVFLVVTIAAIILFVIKIRKYGVTSLAGTEVAFIAILLFYFVGFTSIVLPQILVNLLILIVAVYVIRKGAKKDHLGILNYGLLIITSLLIARFFDGELTFVLRGVLFVLLGVGFFLANYFTVKKRKMKNDEV